MRGSGSRCPASVVCALALAFALSFSAVACRVDEAGLGKTSITVPDDGGAGRASGAGGGAAGGGSGSGGALGNGGSGGSDGAGGSGSGGAPAGAGGGGGATGTGGVSGATGSGGATGTGGVSGAGGSAGSALADASAGGAGGQSDAGTGVDAGADLAPPVDARPVSVVGCADGTREGYLSLTTYDGIAACAGGWDVPGVNAASTRAPACGRRAGNTGANTITDGMGCAVADLCAEGWHVCETAQEVAQQAGDCTDAFTSSTSNGEFFYVTRQRGNGAGIPMCPAANDVGANNIHGCATAGIMEMASCAPFQFSWSHTECAQNRPWACGTNPNDITEADEVTKPGATRGGALCCRD